MLNRILGAVVGVVVAVVVTMLAQMVVHAVYPPPPGDYTKMEVARAAIEQAPALSLIGVILGYGLAAFVGGWVASLVARRGGWHAWVPAVFLLASTLLNVFLLPHPVWFPATAILTILAGAWVSGRFAPRSAEA